MSERAFIYRIFKSKIIVNFGLIAECTLVLCPTLGSWSVEPNHCREKEENRVRDCVAKALWDSHTWRRFCLL